MNDPSRHSLALAFALLALIALGLQTDRPPAPLAADAPVEQFSAGRARETLREITRAPHPVGSAEHTRVRDHLLRALADLGLDPEVQHTTIVSQFRDDYAADVSNIVARIPGTDSSGAVVLMAHYDSVIGSYGASDDGAGVAAVIETARALQTGAPLRNDVIVLLTDAEEIGLLGASAFVQQHPWFASVALVLNVEARGSYGGAFMFQTIGPNGRLIETLADATPRPVANSVMQEVYERLPNGTDLSSFMGTGVAGMDIAYIRGLSHYHTPLDNFETQSPASLQHHGSYLLGLAAAFGDADLSDLEAAPRTYFNLGPLAFVHYPASWTVPLALLAVLAALGVVGTGFARGQLRLVPVLLGLAAAVLAIGVAALLGHLGWTRWLASSESALWDSYRLFYDSTPYLLTFAAAAATLVTTAAWLLRHRTSGAELAVTPLIACALQGVAAAFYVPGAGYLLIWPTLATAAALWVAMRSDPDSPTPIDTGLLALLAAPTLLLLVPLIELLEVAMTLRILAVCAGLMAFVATLLSVQTAALVRSYGNRLPAALLAVTVLAAAWALLAPQHDETRKRPNHVSYVADLDAGIARWVSLDPEVDDWVAQLLGTDPERDRLPDLGFGRTVWLGATDMLALPEPAVTLLQDEQLDSARQIELRLDLPPGTHTTRIETAPGNAEIREAVLQGQWTLPPPEGTDKHYHLLTYRGAPTEGLLLRLTLDGDQPFALRIRTMRPGLPTEPAHSRPPDTMSRGDTTISQRTLLLLPAEPVEPAEPGA